MMKHGGLALSQSKGFTLVEMLIVIAVIAILAGVVLTGVTGFQATARDTRRIGDLKNTQNFLELYYNKCGYYPGGIDAGGDCTTTDPASWSQLEDSMEPDVTSNFPNDPVTGRTYYYGVSGDRLQYVIGAELERDNSVLKDDADGTVYGVDCADAGLIYCIQS